VIKKEGWGVGGEGKGVFEKRQGAPFSANRGGMNRTGSGVVAGPNASNSYK